VGTPLTPAHAQPFVDVPLHFVHLQSLSHSLVTAGDTIDGGGHFQRFGHQVHCERRGKAMTSFQVDEAVWFDEIAKIAQGEKAGPVWATFRSGFLGMIAIQCQLSVDGRSINLYLPPQAPLGQPAIGITVFLSEKGEAEYERRIDEAGNVRLRMTFLASSVKSRFGEAVELVVSNRKEFLGIEASELHVQ
jgi:hypothetical protein